MAASNTGFTQNRLGQSKNPIDSDHGIYRYTRREFITLLGGAAARGRSRRGRSRPSGRGRSA